MYSIFYYDGFNDRDLGDNKGPLKTKFNSIIEDLEDLEKNKYTRPRTRNVKLIIGDGGIKYFRTKLSNGCRLLFKIIKKGDKNILAILEVIPNHDYHKSKFLKSKEKIKSIKIISGDGEEVHDDIEEVDVPPIHWLGKFVTFSAKQEEIVEDAEGKYNLPLVVSGSAGSGKTSVALERLRKIEEKFKEGKVLYITQSENLIKESKKLYEYKYYDETTGKFKTGVPEQIEFLSVHEFIKRITNEDTEIRKRVKGKKPIDRNAFFSWFSKICKEGNFQKYEGNGDKIFEEFTAVIGGGGLGEEEYKALGDRQAIFPKGEKGERDNIYSLFKKYREFIEKDLEYYDPNLIAHECVKMANKVYDAVVVDEVQDLTESTLDLILKSLKDESKGDFLLCGDVNQVIHPSLFSVKILRTKNHQFVFLKRTIVIANKLLN